MKSISHLTFLAFLFLTSCHQKPADKTPVVIDINPAKLPKPMPGEAVATFGGGCFWAVQEEMSLLKGVRTAVSGYAGGDLDYLLEDVGGGRPTLDAA